MADFVRAKLPNGDEFTTSESGARVFHATVIDKPAVDGNGRPLPPKQNIHKGGSKKAASNEKES